MTIRSFRRLAIFLDAVDEWVDVAVASIFSCKSAKVADNLDFLLRLVGVLEIIVTTDNYFFPDVLAERCCEVRTELALELVDFASCFVELVLCLFLFVEECFEVLVELFKHIILLSFV